MLRFALLVFGLLAISMAQAQDQRTLTVFAASSLTDAFEAIGDAFEAANPGVTIRFNFAGSSTLATQLIQGARADVFASADSFQMGRVMDAGLITAQTETFASNRLVVVMPGVYPDSIESLLDLGEPGIRLVVASPGVPIRAYTDAMLDMMAEDAHFGPEYRENVQANIVSEESNVRQVLFKVLLGEADAGIVYQSDLNPDNQDHIIALPVPDSFTPEIRYPIAEPASAAAPELAASFITFVLSEAGQDILEEHGFTRRSEDIEAAPTRCMDRNN